MNIHASSEAFPYELCKVYNDGSTAWVYVVNSMVSPVWTIEYSTAYDEAAAFNRANGASSNLVYTQWYVNGERVQQVFAY